MCRASSQNKAIRLTPKEQVISFPHSIRVLSLPSQISHSLHFFFCHPLALFPLHCPGEEVFGSILIEVSYFLDKTSAVGKTDTIGCESPTALSI